MIMFNDIYVCNKNVHDYINSLPTSTLTVEEGTFYEYRSGGNKFVANSGKITWTNDNVGDFINKLRR